MDDLTISPIGHVYTDFSEKFGIPRQSNIVEQLKAKIVFNSEYSHEHAFKGLNEFSHIWLIWGFSENKNTPRSIMVRPPRLGGNEKRGVFATRSPFRPNPLGLSLVKLDEVCCDPIDGTTLYVSGADMVNGTPIYDIKPYLPHIEAVTEACGGFAQQAVSHILTVDFPKEMLNILPDNKRNAAVEILKQDPRPAYHNDPSRIYGLSFAGYNIKFCVNGSNLTVCAVDKQ